MTTLPASEETVPATDMPERIYARKCGGNCVIGFSTPSLDYNIEYVRADLVQAAREQAARECAENVWQPIETAPKDGATFLAVNAGEIERWHTTQEGVVITVKANDRPTTCAFYDGGDGQSFIDEFGEVYRPDGIVCDAEDLTEVDNVLRLTHWQPLPTPPSLSQVSAKK